MKKTIREDAQRLVLQSEMLNDNALLEITADQGFINVGVRFVESPISGIKEHVLLHMNTVEFMKHPGELIEINEDKSAIATYKPEGEGFSIVHIYDTNSHEFASPEFIDLEYQKRFAGQLMKGQYFRQKQE